MGDVLQYLIDGTSGIVTGGVDGKALVAGVCSRGIVGKAYQRTCRHAGHGAACGPRA